MSDTAEISPWAISASSSSWERPLRRTRSFLVRGSLSGSRAGGSPRSPPGIFASFPERELGFDHFEREKMVPLQTEDVTKTLDFKGTELTVSGG